MTRAIKPESKRRRGARLLDMFFRELPRSTSAAREQAFAEMILSIPRGRVATYGQVAAAAGYPRHSRAVARLLKMMMPGEYPWQRVAGAGGEVKVRGRAAAEQRALLKMEGVTFAGRKANLKKHQHIFESD